MRTQIIAELASCHNGDLDLLKALVKAAAENGCDLVKVQDWRAKNVPEGDQDRQRYERYEFKDEWWPEFIRTCEENRVQPLTTCFNADRAEYLASLGLKTIKLASISLTNHDLILAAGAHFEEVIASTAMHSEDEISDAADLLASNCHKFTMMHCVANYPMHPTQANLARIDSLKKLLEGQEYASVGYSDHALDLDVAKAALSKGISYLEKHVSLSRYLPQIPHQMYEGGPMVTTHQVSIEPHELRELSEWRIKSAIMEGTGAFSNNEAESKIKAKYSNRYGV
jgi:N,N'-diacetyllegionaminate synthase